MFDTDTTHDTLRAYYSSGYHAARRDARLGEADSPMFAAMAVGYAVSPTNAAWWAGYFASITRVMGR